METLHSSNFGNATLACLEPLELEKNYNHERFTAWLETNWTWILYLSAFYAFFVHHGQRWMADRKPFQLRRVLIAWNLALVLFSVAVFLRMQVEIVWQLKDTGFQDTLCHFGRQDTIAQFWGAAFAFSKVFEFGDTLFLVLTKKPIIFLHWYHHATVAIYGFWAGNVTDPAARWFVLINSLIHSIMYSYYALKAMRVRIPKKVSVLITGLQISQMAFGIYINIVTSYLKASGVPCERSTTDIKVAFAMYSSYLVLFANFFHKAYLAKTSKKLK